MIPTYSFDGARLRDYRLESIEWLLEQDSITVHRRRGRIVSARFRATSELRAGSAHGSAYSSVRFTCQESIGEHRRVIAHKALPYYALSDDLTRAQRETVMRAAYSAVQLSVIGGGL